MNNQHVIWIATIFQFSRGKHSLCDPLFLSSIASLPLSSKDPAAAMSSIEKVECRDTSDRTLGDRHLPFCSLCCSRARLSAL